jgi:hypothetical protein
MPVCHKTDLVKVLIPAMSLELRYAFLGSVGLTKDEIFELIFSPRRLHRTPFINEQHHLNHGIVSTVMQKIS